MRTTLETLIEDVVLIAIRRNQYSGKRTDEGLQVSSFSIRNLNKPQTLE